VLVTYCLFVDLDGVLVDFDSGVERVTGARPSEQLPRAMWPRLARTPSFYTHLEWTPDGPLLWEHVRTYHPTILTGLPLGRWAAPQKRAWCERELGREVRVITCMSREKSHRARTATPLDVTPVLIDDRASLRDAFEREGGLFIHHVEAASTIAALERLDGQFVPSQSSDGEH
jgi:hypothetical protein